MSSEAQARAPGPHQQLGRVCPPLASARSHRAPDSGTNDIIVGPLLMQGHGGVSIPTHPTPTKITFSSTVTLSQSPRWCIHLGGWPDLPGSVGLSSVPHLGVGPWISP